jgi:hypothetical protein
MIEMDGDWNLYINYQPRMFPKQNFDIEVKWSVRTCPKLADAWAKANEILTQEWNA